jgi:DNA-binding Xre family transcriptional regulator
MKTRKTESTLDRELKSPSFRAIFEKESATLEVSEFLAKQMAEQSVSVRTLAARASVSATVVQGIKSGKRKNIEYTTLKALTHALGYQIKFKKMNKGHQHPAAHIP